ncbi:MAG: PKD domain-containing protein, partial [Deltaproteobacteria bacterium]|nr:PKD domain-containing protein [Deltaproteobacteria bacterium]
MKPHDAKHTKDAGYKMLAASLAFIFLMLLVAAAGAKPPSAFPGGKRGQEAIVALQERLPAIASRYGKSAEVLQEHFLHDRDLWLDANENLLYLCSFDISETETLPESAESAIPTGPFPLAETFQLHSLKGAERVIYLDFDGHVTANTYWNSSFYGGADIVSLPYDFNGNTASFSDAELSRIQNIWARVAEDFAMYDIDVTTEDPGVEALRRSGSGDKQYGIRVVISPSSSWYGSAGGVAYVGSFAWGSDTPVFVFSNRLGSGNEKYVTDATAHETGHALGLAHDGVTGGTSYYQGHGNWAPIMGVGYYKSLTQWSKGEYSGANNTQDDLAVMLNYGASYRADDHGNWIDSATMLSGDTLEAFGIIERTDDADVFGFQSGAGTISITVDPAQRDPNLDIFVQVLDDAGNIIGEADPYNILPAGLSLSL